MTDMTEMHAPRPEFRARLSSGATDFAARFSWEAAADRFLDLYSEIR